MRANRCEKEVKLCGHAIVNGAFENATVVDSYQTTWWHIPEEKVFLSIEFDEPNGHYMLQECSDAYSL